MIGSRSWCAIMRRNIVYRRRHWVSSVSISFFSNRARDDCVLAVRVMTGSVEELG